MSKFPTSDRHAEFKAIRRFTYLKKQSIYKSHSGIMYNKLFSTLTNKNDLDKNTADKPAV